MSRELGNVIVTGGASGLGAAVADAVRAAGGTALILDRAVPAGGHTYEIVDLGDSLAAEQVVEALARRHGSIDGVVTAAGTDACGPLGGVARDAWEQVVRVNLLGTVAVIRAALPHLERSAGRVVTVASTLGLRALPDATAYCASKFGVVGFTRALASELQGTVGVTMLIPGGMRTAFFDARDSKYQPPAHARLNDPADVARMVVFALGQPVGIEVRELVVTPSREPSWP
jgi:NAD(P)-dependent dehydrogenase (short-subunit alcohol dehydrogenase family)